MAGGILPDMTCLTGGWNNPYGGMGVVDWVVLRSGIRRGLRGVNFLGIRVVTTIVVISPFS